MAAQQTPAEQQKLIEENDALAKARNWYEKQNRMSVIMEGEDDEDFDEEDLDEEQSAASSDY